MDASTALREYTVALTSSPHNLVSDRDRALVASRHVPECVAFAAILPELCTVVDIGAGGGLPGLVIAIVRPDLEVHLVESRAKKATFLQETARAIGIRVTVHHARAEDSPVRGDIVTARAVAPLHRLVGYAAAVTRAGGELWAIKGDQWAGELSEVTDFSGFVVVERPSDPPTRTVSTHLAPGVEVDLDVAPRVVRLRRQRT